MIGQDLPSPDGAPIIVNPCPAPSQKSAQLLVPVMDNLSLAKYALSLPYRLLRGISIRCPVIYSLTVNPPPT